MAETYKITDELKNIQNILIKNTIKANTNVQLLRSEEAIRSVYASYADKIQKVGSKIFDVNDHIVEAQDLITKDYFDELFSDIYIDLKSLYQYIKYIDDLLDINLQKNKKFFNTLEKKIIELENKLDLAKLNINTIVTFDKVYFEGFNSKSKSGYYYNMDVDKKTGHITLQPIITKRLNKKHYIKKVTSTLFPVANAEGGVHVKTNELNTYEESYRLDGTNDMLENGLWKEQVFTNEIPDILTHINNNVSYGSAPEITINTQGLVSYVDIEFRHAININTLDIDLFGEHETSILHILYKVNEDDPWQPFTKLSKRLIDGVEYFYDYFTESSDFNVIKYRNLELINTRFIRIVFNQKNYSLIKNNISNVASLEQKINDDLSERRLDLVKLDGGNAGLPAIPKSYNYDSMYSELTNIVENSSNIAEMLTNIIDTLEPTVKTKDINFNKTLQYELGAWSIEPKLQQYHGIGKYKSANYEFNTKSLVSASLITKQEDIKENTCSWYISDTKNTLVVPVIPNDERIRKEQIYVVENDNYFKNCGYTDGTLIQLDFPLDRRYKNVISLYEDGRVINYSEMEIYFLNSTLLYITNIKDHTIHNYVIKYIPAKYDMVSVYRLVKNGEYEGEINLNFDTLHIDNVLEYNILAPRESLLKLFLDKTDLNNNYTIKRVYCTKSEYDWYFKRNNIAVSTVYYDLYESVLNEYFSINTTGLFLEQYVTLGGVPIFSAEELEPNLYAWPTIPLNNERSI